MKKVLRQAWVEIDLKKLDHNIKEIKKYVDNACKIVGIIKADAYGHGIVRVARTLEKNDIKSFGVATLKEAKKLRKAGFGQEIINLGLLSDECAESIVKLNITPVVCNFNNALAISNEASKQNKIAKIYLVIDTGMGRIGYMDIDEESLYEIKKIEKLPNIEIKGIFSHMAMSGEIDDEFSSKQISKFNESLKKLNENKINIGTKILGNSGAAFYFKDAYFDSLRIGIAMYGCYPNPEVKHDDINLKQVMSVKAKISYLKKIPKGFSIGYGRKYIAEKESVIATLPIGYADGYRRNYFEKGKVIVRGEYAPIAGVICMDQCMIDVTDIKDVKVGDEVILMGEMGDKKITADDIADEIGTISYEVMCGFGLRLEKVYKSEENKKR